MEQTNIGFPLIIVVLMNQTSNVWKLPPSTTCDSAQMPNLKKKNPNPEQIVQLLKPSLEFFTAQRRAQREPKM